MNVAKADPSSTVGTDIIDLLLTVHNSDGDARVFLARVEIFGAEYNLSLVRYLNLSF